MQLHLSHMTSPHGVGLTILRNFSLATFTLVSFPDPPPQRVEGGSGYETTLHMHSWIKHVMSTYSSVKRGQATQDIHREDCQIEHVFHIHSLSVSIVLQ